MYNTVAHCAKHQYPSIFQDILQSFQLENKTMEQVIAFVLGLSDVGPFVYKYINDVGTQMRIEVEFGSTVRVRVRVRTYEK